MEEQKKYLSFGKKLAYGSGDFGSNFFCMMITSFVMFYLTNYSGMDAAVVGTLMMVSKCLDGVTDVFFGRLIDKTHSKMGKARPWMFFSAFPLALCQIAVFAVPEGMPLVGKYVYFFIFYTAANAFFYTANNIAYATMSALITKNEAERVSLGSFRYIFAVVASIIVSSVTVNFVTALGGDTAAWRTVAIIFSVIMLIFNTIASLTCKEIVTEEEEEDHAQQTVEKKDSFLHSLKLIFTNKYYLIMLGIYLAQYVGTGIASVGVYYCQYVLGDTSYMGLMSLSSFVIIIGLVLNPTLVKRFGIYKVNLYCYIVATVLSVFTAFFSFQGNIWGIFIISLPRAVFTAPLLGSLNALVAETAKNTYLRTKVHTEGMMFSCSSIGVKVGSGIGTAMVGWLLSASGYVNGAATQPDSAMFMIKFINGGIPLIMTALLALFLWKMDVVEDNQRLEKKA